MDLIINALQYSGLIITNVIVVNDTTTATTTNHFVLKQVHSALEYMHTILELDITNIVYYTVNHITKALNFNVNTGQCAYCIAMFFDRRRISITMLPGEQK